MSLESQQSKHSSSNRVMVVVVIHLYLKSNDARRAQPEDEKRRPKTNQRMKKRAMLFKISYCLPINNIEILSKPPNHTQTQMTS